MVGSVSNTLLQKTPAKGLLILYIAGYDYAFAFYEEMQF